MTRSIASQQVPVNIVGSSIFGVYPKISAEKTINMFITDNWLVNFAGYKKRYDLIPSGGTGRGVFRSVRGGFIIVVVNSAVYQLNNVLAPVFIGSLASNIGEVFIDENLNGQICIVDGINAYIYNYNIAPNITIQALSGDLVPSYVTFHNTYFLFGNGNKTSNGAAWYAYAHTGDPTTSTTIALLDPGGTFALQTKPDYAVAVKRIPGQASNVLVFGTSVCEVFQQIGGLQNYRRVNTFGVDYGCLSVSTIASSDQYIVWLAVNQNDGPVIMVYSGQGATPISTDGIDYLLGSIQYPEQSTAMFTRVDGHLFYQLTFYNSVDNLTLTYDFNTQKFFNLSDQNLNYHPARDYVYFNQKNYFVSLNNCAVYEISSDLTAIDDNIVNYGSPLYDGSLLHEMQTIRICDTIRQDDSSRMIANCFTMTIEQGNDPRSTELSTNIIYGLITEDLFPAYPNYPIISEDGFVIVDEDSWLGQDAYTIPYQPRVDLSVSYDGAITWSQTSGRTLNTVGKRKNILNWNKLGSNNSLTLKLRFWGLSRFVVYQGVIEVAS